MPKKSKYPVAIMEHEYVIDRAQQTELSKKYGVPLSVIRWLSWKYKWGKKRREYYEQTQVQDRNFSASMRVERKFNVIESLEKLLELKIDAETRAFLKSKNLSPSDIKTLLAIINKSKDNIGETVKTIRLLQGESTGNLTITDEREREDRISRLRAMLPATN